jgi:hypothetical protein
MNPYDTPIDSIKSALARDASSLARDLSSMPGIEDYRNAVCKYISSSFYNGTGKEWLESLGWVYAGIHLASELVPDYVSLTCQPGEDRQDAKAFDYLKGSGDFSFHNFTRFLWPDEAGLRDKFLHSLEIHIESEESESITSLLAGPASLTSGLERLHMCNGISDPVMVPTTIVIPYALKKLFRAVPSKRWDPSLMKNEVLRQFLESTRRYLYHNYYCSIENNLVDKETEKSIRNEEIYESVRNTLLLHQKNGTDPRAIVFFPLVCGSSRIGVFCFVMSRIPSTEDKTHLQSIAETAMNNLFGVDIKLARQRDEGIRKATLFLPLIAHESRSGMNKAALIIDEVLDILEDNEELDVKPRLRRAGDLMQSSAKYLKSFEKTVYDELSRTGSDLTPASLERQIRRLIPPEYEEKIHWVVSGSECIRTPAQSELLAYAVLQMIDNAVEAVESSNKMSPVQAKVSCSVEIETDDETELIITIRDRGPGFTSEQIDSLNKVDLEPVPSSHQGGYGIKTTRLMINQGFSGRMELVESTPDGTTWEIAIPSIKRSSQ